MPLTDAKVRAAEARPSPYKLSDSLGLYLLVTGTSKYWRFDYRFESKRLTLALGVYPEISLAEARKKRDDAREKKRSGIDPGLAKKIGKSNSAENSLEAIGREWFAKKSKGGWSKTHADKVLLRLEKDLFPWLGRRDARGLKAMDFLHVVQKIEQRGAIETAHRVIQYSSSIMRYAIVTGRADINPLPDLKGAIEAPVKGSLASIKEPKKIGGLLRSIDAYPHSFVVRQALRIVPHVFVRPTELRLMEWTELQKTEWRIPPEKMKSRQLHIVPLSTQVQEMIEELRPLTGHGRYVFSARAGRPLSNGALRMALTTLGYTGDEQTVHGFRSAASTLLNEQGWNRDAIERQLAHSERNKVRAAYNYAEHLPERRRMMQAWSDYLDQLKASTTVSAAEH